MSANIKFARIDTLELKAVMYRKIGHQRAEKYFDMLKRFFCFKLGKYEFDKFCIRTIGRDNLPLHNQLIRTILKNSCLAKDPPLRVKKGEESFNVRVASGRKVNSLQSSCSEFFSPSPRKGRSPANRDRKFHDRPSPLGPLGKSPTITCEEVVLRTQEQQSATELHSLGSRPPVEVASVEDGEEVEQATGSPSIQSRSPVIAPLSIAMKMGNARTIFSSGSQSKFHPSTCETTCELPDARSLINRLEQKLEMEGLRISVDCVNLLNNGLDCYLKRLIEPCMKLAGARCVKENHQQRNGESAPGLNGMLHGNGRYTQRPSNSVHASMLDFCVAMRSNPRILGGDWALQLEKVCSHEFEHICSSMFNTYMNQSLQAAKH